MSSNYCSRNRPAEVLIHDGVEGTLHSLIREREKYEEQYSKEHIIKDINVRSLIIEEQSESREDLSGKQNSD